MSIPLLSACISSALTLCRSLRRSHRLCEVIDRAALLYLKDALKRDVSYAWSSEPLLPISRVKTVSSAVLFYFCHYTNNNFYRSIRLREMSSSSRNDCNLKHGYWPLPSVSVLKFTFSQRTKEGRDRSLCRPSYKAVWRSIPSAPNLSFLQGKTNQHFEEHSCIRRFYVTFREIILTTLT